MGSLGQTRYITKRNGPTSASQVDTSTNYRYLCMRDRLFCVAAAVYTLVLHFQITELVEELLERLVARGTLPETALDGFKAGTLDKKIWGKVKKHTHTQTQEHTLLHAHITYIRSHSICQA